MTGVNILIINQATMKDAMEYYLKAIMPERCIKVILVKQEDQVCQTFMVEFERKDTNAGTSI